MKVAEVTYTGRVRQQRHRAPSGTMYEFRGRSPVAVEDEDDVQHFRGKPNFDVEWAARGVLMNVLGDEAESVSEALSEMEYRAKQKIAKELDIPANQAESELEEAIKLKADDIQRSVEANSG